MSALDSIAEQGRKVGRGFAERMTAQRVALRDDPLTDPIREAATGNILPAVRRLVMERAETQALLDRHDDRQAAEGVFWAGFCAGCADYLAAEQARLASGTGNN